jgi:hypothetical protein
MTPEERHKLYQDIEKSHKAHMELVRRIGAGEAFDQDRAWEELREMNEDILRRTKDMMGPSGRIE